MAESRAVLGLAAKRKISTIQADVRYGIVWYGMVWFEWSSCRLDRTTEIIITTSSSRVKDDLCKGLQILTGGFSCFSRSFRHCSKKIPFFIWNTCIGKRQGVKRVNRSRLSISASVALTCSSCEPERGRTYLPRGTLQGGRAGAACREEELWRRGRGQAKGRGIKKKERPKGGGGEGSVRQTP